MQKYILSVTVQNNAGVLARVSSLFGRRGYNIDSLTVSATTDPKVSRMSIIVQGDDPFLSRSSSSCSSSRRSCASTTCRRRIPAAASWSLSSSRLRPAGMRDDIRQLCGLYDAHIVESTENSMIVELSDVPSRIDAFLDVISNFKVIEMSRSGRDRDPEVSAAVFNLFS